MRIRNITIKHWRNFEDIDLQLDPDASLVCVVGANGTGKSHLLELIAACAHRLGLAQGVEIPRGDPFADQHDFSLQFFLAEGISKTTEEFVKQQGFTQWDRTLSIKSQRIGNSTETFVEAGGVTETNPSRSLAQRIVEALQQEQSVHFVSLDADRAYPKKNVQIHEIAQAYAIDWEGTEYTRGRSYRMTATLYDEWIKYFLAQENQSGTRLIQEIRRARKSGAEPPKFNDPFESYAASLQKVLPHVLFTGVDSKAHTLLFDTTGLELSFNQLSGGEREIAFLVGQIDRFGLRQGLFLLDEPELHLNADLIRNWVTFLTSSIETGQIWLATHSLEAVEATGQQSTFVLERNEHTRKVDSLVRLDARPVLSALSRAVGTPAFSISRLRFVFVEGEEGIGEREHFRRLSAAAEDVRFIECGSCNEVLRRVPVIKTLAKESDTEIRVGGVIDRDFRTESEAERINSEDSVFVLPVHERENLFLHPATLSVLLEQNGYTNIVPTDLIREAADARAGSWIFQWAMATANAQSLPAISPKAKDLAKNQTWGCITADRDAVFNAVVGACGYATEDCTKLQQLLRVGADSYARKRTEDNFWRVCEGKQVLNEVSRRAGFGGAPALAQAAFAAWGREQALIPQELVTLRNYLTTL